jgi:hypothetical protein
MTTIITRAGKGSPLTNNEVDSNFTNLNSGKAEVGANTDITSVALTSGTVTTAPSGNNDIVNKLYADSIASGINFHSACNYATTADLGTVTYANGTAGVGATLTKTSPFATLSIDGASPAVGNRILLKNQTTAAQNGAYVVTSVGSGSVGWVLTRATDYDTSGSGINEVDQGDFFLVLSGTTNGNTSWIQQTPLPITIGTTDLAFTQFGAGPTYPISVLNGGTGATTIAGAQTNLQVDPAGTAVALAIALG